jgi:hypothetical protein
MPDDICAAPFKTDLSDKKHIKLINENQDF